MENKHPKRNRSAYSKEKALEKLKRRVCFARYFVPEWLSWMESSVHIWCDVRFEYIYVSYGKFREDTQKLMLVWMSKKQTRNRENKEKAHTQLQDNTEVVVVQCFDYALAMLEHGVRSFSVHWLSDGWFFFHSFFFWICINTTPIVMVFFCFHFSFEYIKKHQLFCIHVFIFLRLFYWAYLFCSAFLLLFSCFIFFSYSYMHMNLCFAFICPWKWYEFILVFSFFRLRGFVF